MSDLRAGIVAIVRDFLLVHQSLGLLLEHCRAGRPCFDACERLVGDDASSALYRLKEECHATFRPSADQDGLEVRTGILLDLTVGSLFHEAMKLRENLYQQERYGPRVKALKVGSDPAAIELLAEFEKMLESSAARLSEAVEEVDRLLARTRKQWLGLLVEHSDDGLLARCLHEERELFTLVVSDGPEGFFAQVHGDPVTGFIGAADSYLDSAYFEEALEVLEKALTISPGRGDLVHATDFARGMEAFVGRNYPECISNLSNWAESIGDGDAASRKWLALSAIRHIVKAAEQDPAASEVLNAKELQDQLEAVVDR